VEGHKEQGRRGKGEVGKREGYSRKAKRKEKEKEGNCKSKISPVIAAYNIK